MSRKKSILVVGSNYYEDIFDNLVAEAKEEVEKNNLFSDNQMSMFMHLIPEYKNFDFIIKITGLVFNKKEIISLINKINNIEIISEIAELENLSIQSKGNLCF